MHLQRLPTLSLELVIQQLLLLGCSPGDLAHLLQSCKALSEAWRSFCGNHHHAMVLAIWARSCYEYRTFTQILKMRIGCLDGVIAHLASDVAGDNGLLAR